MRTLGSKIYQFIESVGKRNFILVFFILCVVLITSLYATFSLTTFNEGVGLIDGVKTLKFVLGSDSMDRSVMIVGGGTKNIAITVSNHENIPLKYGIFYSSSDNLDDVVIGYHHLSEYLPNGVIEPLHDYIITIQVENNSPDMKTISFGLVFGLESGGDLIIGESQHFLSKKMNFPLSEVPVGSYVLYSGSNGCSEGSCSGVNANAVMEADINGYCGDVKDVFLNSGWRVAYSKRNSAYLISAGATSCVEKKEDTVDYLKLFNENAIQYCSIDYAYRGICDETSSWAMNIDDFYHITGSYIDEDECLEQENRSECGHSNDLIDIGGNYWLSSMISKSFLYYQNYPMRYVYSASNSSKGVRPVLRLASSVVVIDGDGTKKNPYKIKNTKVADYTYKIVYNGNGASSGDTPDSNHKTNILQKLNKNGFSLSYQLKLSEIGHFDDSYCDDDGRCHESSILDVENREAKFLGWSLFADAKEATYLDEAEVINLSSSSNEVIVNLYAVWDYMIYTLPKIQERDGYEIIGWYTEKDGGEKIGNPGDTFDFSKVENFYARWAKKTS